MGRFPRHNGARVDDRRAGLRDGVASSKRVVGAGGDGHGYGHVILNLPMALSCPRRHKFSPGQRGAR